MTVTPINSKLADTVRLENASWASAGQPHLPILGDLWEVLERELTTALEAGDEVRAQRVIARYRTAALTAINKADSRTSPPHNSSPPKTWPNAGRSRRATSTD